MLGFFWFFFTFEQRRCISPALTHPAASLEKMISASNLQIRFWLITLEPTWSLGSRPEPPGAGARIPEAHSLNYVNKQSNLGPRAQIQSLLTLVDRKLLQRHVRPRGQTQMKSAAGKNTLKTGQELSSTFILGLSAFNTSHGSCSPHLIG